MSNTTQNQARVLYVDDLQANLILFQATFGQYFHIILADSALKALDILKEEEVHVLVTDQRMPDMTGTELLEKVAVDYPDIRRFLLTAFTDFETVVEAVNKGHIHGYINKPLKEDEVRLAIQNSMEVYDLRKKNTQIMEELAKANAELLSLDTLKSEIIRVISMEIRNPLNRIMGTLHMLKDKIESRELINVVNILDSSVSRLEEFSSMTEQISILKTPGHRLKEEEINFRRVIEYGMVETREKVQEESIRLDLQPGGENMSIKGEFHLLVSCLVHIINNGIRHTRKEETLTVRTAEVDGEVICEITDSGKDYSPAIFEELENHFSESGQKINLNLGIELGLSLMIMEAHGGSIRFQKTDDNKGSVSMVFRKDENS